MTDTAIEPETEDLTVPTEGAPFGRMKDAKTGEIRPKLRPGKVRVPPKAEDVTPRSQPSLDALKAQQAARAPAEDVAPGKPPKGGKKVHAIPRHRPGFITRGVNKWYKRIGKIAKTMDADLGAAIIATTVNDADEGEPDNSVGAAWDALAAVNPQVRRVLMNALEGGVYGALFWAHVPIFMALLMKTGILDRLPVAKLAMAFMSDDEPGPQGESTVLGGMTQADMMQAMALAQQHMAGLGLVVNGDGSMQEPGGST